MSDNNTQTISCQLPGCGCIIVVLAIVGFLYMIGAIH